MVRSMHRVPEIAIVIRDERYVVDLGTTMIDTGIPVDIEVSMNPRGWDSQEIAGRIEDAIRRKIREVLDFVYPELPEVILNIPGF